MQCREEVQDDNGFSRAWSVNAHRALESDRSHEKFAPLTPKQEEVAGITPSDFGVDMDEDEASALLTHLDFANGEELLAYCEEEGLAISDAICRLERRLLVLQGIAVDDTHRYVDDVIAVMRASVKLAVENPQTSMGGLIGGEARCLSALDSAGTICDSLTLRAITYAMAVLETNASMGRIVAAPTAGSWRHRVRSAMPPELSTRLSQRNSRSRVSSRRSALTRRCGPWTRSADRFPSSCEKVPSAVLPRRRQLACSARSALDAMGKKEDKTRSCALSYKKHIAYQIPACK